MRTPKNKLKAMLNSGGVAKGIWLNMRNPLTAEMAGNAGFNWCLLDGEHGPNSLTEMFTQVQALEATKADSIVRIVAPEFWMIKQVLDIGVQNIMLPQVNDVATAEMAAKAMRYPPVGNRGMGAAIARAAAYGAMTNYIAEADAEMFCIVQAESKAAADNVEEIAKVDGVDCVFIGPADLAADFGHSDDSSKPEVQEAIAHIIAKTKDAGKVPGILAFSPEDIARYEEMGARLVGVGADIAIFRNALAQVANY